MKPLVRFLLAVAIFTLGHGTVDADGGYTFEFSSALKKTAGQKNEATDREVKKEKWAYSVSIENKSFKDIPNVEVKYVMFIRADPAGQKVDLQHAKYKRHEGSTTIALFKNNDKFTFTTDEVALTSVELSGGYYWPNGADPNAKDALKGIWVRLFVNNVQVGEFINPPELSSKESWEAPPPAQ